jgi:hypothetical protein
MLKATTMPAIRKAIISQLTAWHSLDAPPAPNHAWPSVNHLVRAQGQVGWRAFLEGCVLKAWAAKQHEYYVWLNHKNTGHR